jgi:hypothetical protein
LEFVRWDALTNDETDALDQFHKVIVRERHVSVFLKDCLRPAAVARAVEDGIPYRFSPSTHHSRCWRHFHVRPSPGADHPERTEERYCLWSEPQNEYLYTPAWVRKLTAALSDAEGFKAVTGFEPVAKASASRG